MTNSPPEMTKPDEDWSHFSLWKRVTEAIKDIPEHFKTKISVSGVNATDIFTFGPSINSAIERNVALTLNHMRDEWDPDDDYESYEFIRQAETFPDFLLKNRVKNDIIMGIELKSWFLLSKEKEPSFRFKVTPAACAPADLLVVIPWALSDAISGEPQVFDPYVKPAKYVAEYRNYYWQELRNTSDDTEINAPENVEPYPTGREKIQDKPVYNGGYNFGRIARVHTDEVMDNFVENCISKDISGIEVEKWIDFLRAVSQ